MAKSPADTVAALLAAQGLGVLPPATVPVGSWRINVGRQGPNTDQQITVYDTGGLADNPVWRVNYPSIQVRVRGPRDRYDIGWEKANDIKELLVGLESQDLAGDRWTAVNMFGGVAFIGYDSVSRPEFTVNFRCIVEPAADSSPFMHRESL